MQLIEKAIEMAEIYKQNSKVEAIILAGSVARKLEDEHCITSSVADGVSLYGKMKVNELKDRVAIYPEKLTNRMISENLWLSNRWHNREALLKRNDWLMLYDVICEVQRDLFGVLFGLNKIYVHHPSFKWMSYNTERMNMKPTNLYERMTNILIGNPERSVRELEILVQEVLELVRTYAPECNIAEQQKRIQYAK
ncbi:DUF4037 domain-containing protein [Bacillus pseudomycoides]|uniref:DUF4037 domain-containing protein n=1 Tax=Bacillus bingmayongensis TaxID=1150157 RepID=A0ABU5JWI4_9BACI|nr:DUF4037 domain-containing protein [Bacillus pseudomycoides]